MITVNVGEFLNDIENERGKLIESHVNIIRKFVFDIFTSTVLNTPIVTGNLRANWIPSVETPDTGTVIFSELSENQATEMSLRRLEKFRNYNEIPNFWYIVNNLDYASYIEEGHSKKAPEGMLAISINQAENKLKLLGLRE